MARSIDTAQLRALTDTLNAAGREAPDRVEVVVRKTMADVTATARITAPVDTGNLRSSIGYDVTRDATSITGEAGPTASYGDHVESGTSRHGPQPYMGPGLDRHLPTLELALAQVAGDALG